MKANGAVSRSLFAESGADREDAGSCSPSPGIKLRTCFHFVTDVCTRGSKDVGEDPAVGDSRVWLWWNNERAVVEFLGALISSILLN